MSKSLVLNVRVRLRGLLNKEADRPELFYISKTVKTIQKLRRAVLTVFGRSLTLIVLK